MCSNPPDPDDHKPTLIVAPLSLLNQVNRFIIKTHKFQQWMSEIEERTKNGTFSVYKHHGSGRIISARRIMAEYDVVLTTYGVLGTECPVNEEEHAAKQKRKKAKKMKLKAALNPDQDFIDDDDEDEDSGRDNAPKRTISTLYQVEWHRVILDEAHIIKNRTTKASGAVTHLKSKYRWCLTGTPIQNSIHDLFGLIRFLDIKPYCDWGHFQHHITKPFSSGRRTAVVTKVKLVLEALCLRRTKGYILGECLIFIY